MEVYGPVTEQGVWGIGNIREVRELYKTPRLIADIKMRSLEWLGHVIGMDLTAVAKKCFWK
jgi:hypothetical protein